MYAEIYSQKFSVLIGYEKTNKYHMICATSIESKLKIT